MRARASIAAALILIGVGVWWWLRRPAADTSEREKRRSSDDRRPAQGRLDVEAFREQLAERVRRARRLAAQRPAPKARSAAWSMQGEGVVPGMAMGMIDPQCYLGPRAVCDALAGLAAECDSGDALACIAIGQYLADTPPRMLVAHMFFYQACKIGEPEGCARLDDLLPSSTVPCEADPFACGWRAYRMDDPELHEQACSLGAAESCSMLAMKTTDLGRSRAYQETACQLGSPLGCWGLALALDPDCEEHENMRCYEPNEAEAKQALAMACETGWMDAQACSR